MSAEAGGALIETIRREGLIAVAIIALGWQVYWITKNASEQDRLWREELSKYRQEATETYRERIATTQKLTGEVTKLHERLEQVEQACRGSSNL